MLWILHYISFRNNTHTQNVCAQFPALSRLKQKIMTLSQIHKIINPETTQMAENNMLPPPPRLQTNSSAAWSPGRACKEILHQQRNKHSKAFPAAHSFSWKDDARSLSNTYRVGFWGGSAQRAIGDHTTAVMLCALIVKPLRAAVYHHPPPPPQRFGVAVAGWQRINRDVLSLFVETSEQLRPC